MLKWFRRRSNQKVLLWTLLIGCGMGFLRGIQVSDFWYWVFVSSSNFWLGAWYVKAQLREELDG